MERKASTRKIVTRPTASLVHYAKNARLHSAAQVAQLVASIGEWGFTNPVLIDAAGEIIAGHGRVLAAERLKLEKVPCIVLDDLTPDQVRAYRLADNQLALNSSWDDGLLAGELGNLAEQGFDPTLAGFEAPAPPDGGPGNAAGGGGNYKEQYGVIVICKDETHQREVFDALTSQGYEPKVVVT
jgi:hypothetical protein